MMQNVASQTIFEFPISETSDLPTSLTKTNTVANNAIILSLLLTSLENVICGNYQFLICVLAKIVTLVDGKF